MLYKKIKMLFTNLGRSLLGKTVPSVFSTKTSGTVFPNTDLPAGDNLYTLRLNPDLRDDGALPEFSGLSVATVQVAWHNCDDY